MSGARTIRVDTVGGVYGVRVGAGLLETLGEVTHSTVPGARRAQIVFDTGLPAETVDKVAASIEAAGLEVGRSGLEPGEHSKTLAAAEGLLVQLANARHERRDVVIALGGGVVGDVAGFVAATYRRGCPVIQCPTTLLAMVDASVGGKTGVNLSVGHHGTRKNFVGAFHQPAAVLADTSTLLSLSRRTLHAGLAECVKHGLIAGTRTVGSPDPELFAWTEDNAEALHDPSSPEMAELIARNVAVKAAVVRGDEKELAPSAKGGRALLNLGHTFAHAIEPLESLSPDGEPGSAPLMHGEAVAVGTIAACAAAADLGLCRADVGDRARVLCERLGLPATVAGLPPTEDLIGAMMHDKKVESGRVRLILPDGMGTARVVEDPAASAIEAGWAAVRC